MPNEFEVESDERGFVLVVSTSGGDLHRFGITDPEKLHEQVTRIIGSWLDEGRAARSGRLTDGGYENPRAYDRPGSAFACNPDESGGYAANDPKQPQFHSVHADLYDARAGK